ncbi:MAG TPA: type II secretion system protein GspL [Steroidobacteraceae bacterium]|nr:type II secretion system protein GspL [Steroidobacteraceae bacterium]
MADWLLIRLNRESPALGSWLVADGAGRMVQPPQKGTLLQAAALAGFRRVCVLVPAADVVLTEVDVPVKSGARVHQVVPFALEEQLAEDIEQLHFALGKRPADAVRTPVAVISRALMEQYTRALKDAGLAAEAMYAESDLLPANPGQAVALFDQDCAIVRPAGGHPVTMPLEAIGEALTLTAPPRADESGHERSGRGLVLYTGAPEWHQHAREVEAIRDRFDGIKVQLLTDGPLGLFAQQLGSAASAINLLQGPYQPQGSLTGGLRAWRLAAALLAGVIALHAAGSATELMVLKRAEHRLDASIEETFRAAMPGEHNATNARRRMEQRLLNVRAGGESSGLLAALGALSQARPAAQGSVIEALNFREGALDLKVAAPNADVLDHLSQALRASGWDADLTSGNAVGSRYEGRIQVKPRR